MNTPPKLTIAIDGPASSGKGTMARLLAQKLGFSYIDTGALYRVVGLRATEAGLDLRDGPAVGALAAGLALRFGWTSAGLRIYDGEADLSDAIRNEVVGRAASDVAVLPEVRAALLAFQRALGAAGGVVMDGRDIGTVVLKDAGLKIHLDASAEERAGRRFRELRAKGEDVEQKTVLHEIIARDAQDKGRAAAPLLCADDAVVVDSTGRTPEEVLTELLALVQARS